MPGQLDSEPRLKRLEALADLWGKVYLFHPAIVTSDIDWNQALIRAIPRVEAAETPDDLVNALNQELLGPLGDPLTFACRLQHLSAAQARQTLEEIRRFEAGLISASVGYVRVPAPPSRGPGFLTDFQAAVAGLGPVKKLVVDLRWPCALGYRMTDPVLGFFVRPGLATGPVMNRVHEGWSEDNRLGAYKQKWEVISGARLHPIQEADWYLAALSPGTDFSQLETITTPTVFLVNRTSAVSYHRFLDALQSQPGVTVVLESSGPAGEALPLLPGFASGVTVQLNTERLVGHDGSAGFCPDLVVNEEIGPAQLATVAEQALAAKARTPKPPAAPELMNLKLPLPLSETKASLNREERLLGLFKLWNVVRHLYPHLQFCDIDWDSCLREWIPKVEEADSPVAYVRALRMLTAHLHDNNIFYYFPGLPEPQALPVGFGWVEDKIIVTDVLPEALTAVSGQPSAVGSAELQVGDELVEFDGKTVPEIVAEHRLQFSYSTEGSFCRHMCEMLGFGTAGAEVKLVLRRTRGQDPESQRSRSCPQDISLTMKRTVTREAWVGHLARKRESRGCRLLEGNLGYMNLGMLSNLAEFDRTFESLRRADGLIIDIRGYPGFMVQLALSARLSDRPVRSAIFEIPVVSGFVRLEQGWNAGQYEVQPDPKTRYTGPVVVLINERTFGGSEDICIYLKNADRVTFVGGQTAGCNGNRTWVSLPGGGRLWFTGMRVKFGDGSQFQNRGIQPDLSVAPTVAGIRAGRDEVLEKGIEVLRHLVHRASSSAPAQTRDEQTRDKGQGDQGRPR